MQARFDQLQDLRGIAILMVVMFHAGPGLAPFVHGNNGVLLFFMVSGFIIAAIHGNDRGPRDFQQFLRKRAARIFPPYLPVALTFILLFAITGRGESFHHDGINMLRNLLLIQDPNESIHPYAWTLVFELYYYATFGLLSIVLRLGPAGFAAILSAPVIIALFTGSSDDRNLLTSSYNLYFTIGVLISNVAKMPRWHTPSYLAWILFAVFVLTPFTTDSSWWLLGTSSAFFLAYTTQPRSVSSLYSVGNASYSIYLAHALSITLGKHLVPSGYGGFFLLVPVSLAFGFAYFRWIERPLTAAARRSLQV